jgi:hypothetical protein
MRQHLLCVACLCACGPARERGPGEPIGTYRVTATLEASSCGDGALRAPDPWTFEVRLSRDGSDLFWLNGSGVVSGSIEPDGTSFAFAAQATVPIGEQDPGSAGCRVVREDQASGALAASDPPSGFTGRLSYAYAAAAEADCSAWVDVEGGLDALPCAIEYSMQASRVGD